HPSLRGLLGRRFLLNNRYKSGELYARYRCAAVVRPMSAPSLSSRQTNTAACLVSRAMLEHLVGYGAKTGVLRRMHRRWVHRPRGRLNLTGPSSRESTSPL